MEAYISKINYVLMLIMNANTICTFRIIYKKKRKIKLTNSRNYCNLIVR